MFAYPMCLFPRLLTNMSSIAPNSSCLRVLLVPLYCLYSLVTLECRRRISMIWGPVLSGGIVGAGPRLAGDTKGTRLSVLYTAGVTVRNRRPRDQFPR